MREQLGVRAALDDLAALEDEDLIGVHDGREPVRDDEHGAAGEQSVDRFLHEALRLRVERGRRFVEDEDRRIGEQRARDRQALALTAGEPRAALAEDGVVAVGQLADEAVRVRGARRRLDLRVGEPIGRAVGDVVSHRVVEQHRVLAHDSGQPAQRGERDLARIDSVETDDAARSAHRSAE